MEKTYNPQQIEQKWYQTWESNNYFAPSGKGQPYCIVIPPPNVTGILHMGHGFQYSLMDALVRYHKMQGYNTLWQVGSDHAGIATQMVVEHQLEKKGLTRQTLGRDNFVKKIWEWKQVSGDQISKQQRRMGIAADWKRERFTMDEGLARAVLHAFITLYDEGLIYRGKRLANWDPVLNTAISDLEVVNEETDGQLWYINYPLIDEKGLVTIATTRPETMFGDVAVAVHPDDPRYQHLVGKQAKLPLTGRTIPIIADAAIEPSFGSGCVKITPAHDFNDYAIGERHNLPIINTLNLKMQLNENVPLPYRGLNRFLARDRILADLSALGLVAKSEAHRIKIPKGDRSGAVVEPYLTNQWFVKTKDLAKPAIDAVKSGKIKFVPESWNKTYFQWLENIQDWCISRQLWWGHRIPAWYDDQGNIYVGHSLQEIKAKYKLDANFKLTQDEDVLDTWFSSSLWPFASLGWPEKTADFSTFFPTSVLVTGFDIIFFWVARMVMMSLKFTGEVPFTEIYVTGLIRDNKGKKMSKSKGNIIDPVDLIDGISLEDLISKRTQNLMQGSLVDTIEKNTRVDFPQGIAAFGTDALRFTFCALASTGRDINFDFGRLEGYRNFCTKLWNAARYVLLQFQSPSVQTTAKLTPEFSTADRWIKAKFQQTILGINNNFREYRFDLLAQTLYDFIWHEYCDWYVEFCKSILTAPQTSPNLKLGAQQTLAEILEGALRLIHPITPFISEEIWQQIAPCVGIQPTSIMLQQYPTANEKEIDVGIIQEMEWLKKMIIAVRNIRGEMNIAPKKPLNLKLAHGNELDKKYVSQHRLYLLHLARLEDIEWDYNGKNALSASALVDTLELYIPMEDIIDKHAEIWRLEKEITRLNRDYAMLVRKLQNQEYCTKAPQNVVIKEQQRLAELQTTLAKLQQNLASVKAL